jgi:hypothetical protein
MSTDCSRYLSWVSTPKIRDSYGRVILEEKNGVWIHYSYYSNPGFSRDKFVLEDFVPIFDYQAICPRRDPSSERRLHPERAEGIWFLAGTHTHRTPPEVREYGRFPTGKQERVNLWLSLKNGCFHLEGVEEKN